MKLRFLWRAFKTRFRDCRIELSALKAHICPTDIVCDIGANKGSFILWLSKWAHKGKVVAFEPQISLVEYLVDVTKVLSLTNVIIEPKAVSSRKGKAHLYIPGGSVSPVLVPLCVRQLLIEKNVLFLRLKSSLSMIISV
ncbi:MAG: FkbM family methyltransferase [Thermodesulfobacteriota bacterium]|nr:FkbM family methyltransferase [Thermodesulfobacteriota bacterium]